MEVFRAADRNSDGILTKSEIKKYLAASQNLRQKLLGREGWAGLFSALDKDGDGVKDEDKSTYPVAEPLSTVQ